MCVIALESDEKVLLNDMPTVQSLSTVTALEVDLITWRIELGAPFCELENKEVGLVVAMDAATEMNVVWSSILQHVGNNENLACF